MRTDFDGTTQDAVVYFGALGWCAPCKTLHPLMEGLANEHEDLDIFYVDVDEQSELAQEYRIMAVPTVKFFVGGEEKEAVSGLRQKRYYDTLISAYYYEV